jgi:hypothetical protein
MLWFKPSGASGKRTWCGRRVGRAGAPPHLGPRTMVRRHDDGLGAQHVRAAEEGAAAHSLRGVHPAQRWRQETCGRLAAGIS